MTTFGDVARKEHWSTSLNQELGTHTKGISTSTVGRFGPPGNGMDRQKDEKKKLSMGLTLKFVFDLTTFNTFWLTIRLSVTIQKLGIWLNSWVSALR